MFSKMNEFNLTELLKKNFPTLFKNKTKKDNSKNIGTMEKKLMLADKYALEAKVTGFATGLFIGLAIFALLLSIGFIIP